jgi:hypothetical protein
MTIFAPQSPERIEENWRRWREAKADVPIQPPHPVNLNAVLDLGNTVYRNFRGRPYCVPPLPVDEGAKMFELWFEIESLGLVITADVHQAYYRGFRKLQQLIWRNVRPVGLVRRALRRVGILRNPWATATEPEVTDWVRFFFELRTRQPGQYLRKPMLSRRALSTGLKTIT